MAASDVIIQIRSRSEKGIEELLTHYGPLMRYIIAPILHDENDREECLNDAVMQVWNNIDQYDESRGSWNGWLTAVTRNTALNRAKKNKRLGDIDALDEKMPSDTPTPEEAALQNERKQMLFGALKQLSEKERTLFYRKYYYMQPTAQIARESGMTERAVEGRLYRIKQKLRDMMGGEGYE